MNVLLKEQNTHNQTYTMLVLHNVILYKPQKGIAVCTHMVESNCVTVTLEQLPNCYSESIFYSYISI